MNIYGIVNNKKGKTFAFPFKNNLCYDTIEPYANIQSMMGYYHY